MSEHKWLLIIVMAVILFFALRYHTKQNKIRCIQVVTVILTCFSGFRSWRMGDLFHYCHTFITCNTPGWELEFNSLGDTIGLQLLFRLFGQLGLGFEVFIFFISAFSAITLGVLVYRYSPSPYWSYVIYIAMGFYLSSMNTLKQTIAMILIIYSMMAIFERKPLSFILWTLFASLFHTPSLIFVIAYPFANKKIDSIYFLLIACMATIVFRFRDEIVQFGNEIYYVENMSFEAAETIGTKVIVMILILVLALTIRPLRSHDVFYRQLFNIMILAALTQTFSVYDHVFSRLADYFYQFIILFIPIMLESGINQAKQFPSHADSIRYWPPKLILLLQIGITIFSIYFYFSNVNSSSALLSSFQFFWESNEPSSLDLLADAIAEYSPF